MSLHDGECALPLSCFALGSGPLQNVINLHYLAETLVFRAYRGDLDGKVLPFSYDANPPRI